MSLELPKQEVGEPQLADFLRAHWDALYGYFLRRLDGDGHVADDLRQLTANGLMLLWRRRSGIEAEEAVKLLYGIARRKLADHFRALGRDPAPVLPRSRLSDRDERDDEQRTQDKDPNGEDDLDLVLLQVDLAALWDTLTARQQQVVEHHCLDGFDQKTTAQIMGITVSAVQQHLAAARRHLRKALTVNDNPSTGTSTKEAR